ncbi:uncharacterized protein [Palaemon carinicauda]|uniref:uncharacterized protein n=1 Tax=Palaemon carinicauda TaxID=392227 RepID=UPI0035B6A516
MLHQGENGGAKILQAVVESDAVPDELDSGINVVFKYETSEGATANEEGKVAELKEEEEEEGKGNEEEEDEVNDNDDGNESNEDQSSNKGERTLLSNCTLFDVIEALIALVFGLLSVACILVAVIYINYCIENGANFLCAWLIVHGICILSAMTSTIFWRDHKKQPGSNFAAAGSYLLALILILFSTFWLIIGNIVVWIWWGLDWNGEQSCYEDMLKFSAAIVIVFDCFWFLIALISVIQAIRGKCFEKEDDNMQDIKETPGTEETEAPLDNRKIAEQYFQSLFCPTHARVTWQSCIGYSTLMLYFIMSVISLVIGAIYENRCPNTKIPLWLLVQAVCTIITIMIKACFRIKCRPRTISTRKFVLSFFPLSVFLIFQIAWLAIGNDWAFHLWRHERLNFTSTINSTDTTEFTICDQKLYIFFCCVIALFDIPVMVFVQLSIAMTIVLMFYFASPCFPDDLCGGSNEGQDLMDQVNKDKEKGDTENGTTTGAHVNINLKY